MTRKMRQRTTWAECVCTDSAWRDRRTGTILAAGAVQNWPTSREENQINAERAELDRNINALVREEQKRVEQERVVSKLVAKQK